MLRHLFLACIALVALFSSPAFGHVRLLQTGFPIRNAVSAKLDGAYSVSGPCGGVSKYGVQGVTTITSRQVISLKIGYNGGHQSVDNAFHAAYYCGTIATGSTFDDSVLRQSTQPVTLATPRLLPLTDGTALVGAATSLTSGYTLTFNAPALPSGSTGQDCVISLLDQRNWGGCVDIRLLPAGQSNPTGSSTTLGVQKSPCTTYCEMLAANCKAPYVQFPDAVTKLDCMTTCGNYTSVEETPGQAVTTGDNLQCRQHHVEYVASTGEPNVHCPHSGARPTADSGCFQTVAMGERAVSPCFKYCTAMESKCSNSQYFGSRNECLYKCAGFLTSGLGSDVAQGNNTQCRTAAALAGRCEDANPTASGVCTQANPLLLANDTVSAVYATQSGQCDTLAAAAANTISGCCCISGTLTVIHVKGSTIASVSSNLTITGGQMCKSGFQSVPNAADPTKPNSNYTFTSPVKIDQFSFYLRQTSDVTSTDLRGTFTIGGDPFIFELVDNLLVITNDVPSTQSPRVCSIQAKAVSKIDTTGMAIPVDPNNTGGGGAAAATPITSVLAILFAAIMAVMAMRQ